MLGFPIQYLWFSKIINAKMTKLGYNIEKPFMLEQPEFKKDVGNVIIKGWLMKRSQHFKKWENRFVIINADGLFSYKDPNKTYSFIIKTSSVKYIWTRFDIQNKHLIVKVKHGLDKTEFAIPIVNFMQASEANWLWPFYQMLRGAIGDIHA